MSDADAHIHPELPQPLFSELASSVRGTVLSRRHQDFKAHTTLFNGHMVPRATAVVIPIDAQDVSSAIQFCVKHHLSPSVKAGGYGTAGWAIAGDIVLDLSQLNGIDIEPPSVDGGFTPLLDMPDISQKGKGKAASAGNTTAGEKRRRSPSTEPEPELPRNRAVAQFLRGEAVPPPSIRRRVEDRTDGINPEVMESSRSSSGSSNDDLTEASTNATTPYATLSTPPTSPEDADEQDKFTKASRSRPLGLQIRSPAAEFARSPDVDTTMDTPPDAEVQGSTAQSEIEPTVSHVTSSISSRNETSRPSPEHVPAGYDIRSSDPFGYLTSATPSYEPSRSSYAQPTFQPAAQRPSQAGPSRFSAGSSGRIYLNMGEQAPRATPMAATAPSSFMPSAMAPVHPHAYVTFGAGVKQKEIDSYTASNPLPAVDFGGNPSRMAYHIPLAAHPVGSSVMVLGGFGFLSRLHGLSIDALVEAEVVLADGSIVMVSEKENTDLWWALRGAGPAFGVVTRYKAKAYPVPVVFAGNLIYKFRPSTAASLIKHFRDCVKGAPRELYANVLFTAGPRDKDSVIVVQICYVGSRAKGQEFLQAISSWDGERCLLNEVDEKSFLHQQDSVAQILRGKGRQWYIRSTLVTAMPDDVIHATVNKFADAPLGCTWLFELAGGAVADFEGSCVPVSQRQAIFTIAAFHQWEIDVDDPRCKAIAEEWISDTLGPVSTGGPYPSFLGRNEKPSRVIASFGENWPRLCELKRKYDPNGLFRNTFWPLDIHGETIEAHTHEPASP